MRQILTLVSVVVLAAAAAACDSDDDSSAGSTRGTSGSVAGTAAGARPAASTSEGTSLAPPTSTEDVVTIVVTTSILGDIVGQVVGNLAEVEVVMPLGADPHDFAPSVRQAETMEDADILVINGLGFEEGMAGVISSVAGAGTPVFEFAGSVRPLPAIETKGGHPGDQEADEATENTLADEDLTEGDISEFEGGQERQHAAGSGDPHVWTDPARMVLGVRSLVDILAFTTDIDVQSLNKQADAYVAELEALDAEIETSLEVIPADDRILVTNHEVFAYFADRYGFEIVGAVVPSLTTSAETSSRELEDLAALITTEGIPVIFADTTQSTDLAEALADEVGGEVAIVELFTESLGGPDSGAETYIDLMRTNAELIVAALVGA